MKVVFMDKDGTLVEDLPYNVDPERIRLAPGAAEAVAQMAAGGYRVMVVSNQPGIALGCFQESALGEVERKLRSLLPELDGFYYCPHAPQSGCRCRKPACGLLRQAAREHRIELRGSWMVGDILDDIEAGRSAGCRTVLVDNGNETEWRLTARRHPHARVDGLLEVASLICGAP